MKYLHSLRRLWLRLLDWRRWGQAPTPAPFVPDIVAIEPTLARDVSRSGVRFFALCAACGCRLQSSATLCEDCAHRRSREPWA
jgi:hypothetical protein